MERYDYFAAVRSDVVDYIAENIETTDWTGNRNGLQDYLQDELWTVDSVTGNGSGSYTFNAWAAEENLTHNWELMEEAAREFGIDTTVSDSWEHGPEWWDVTIRCYLLGIVVSDVLDEMEENGAFNDPTEATA